MHSTPAVQHICALPAVILCTEPPPTQCVQVRLADSPAALMVDLEPRDVLYIPPMWFHEAQALSSSIGVNIWTQPTEVAAADWNRMLCRVQREVRSVMQ